MVNKVNGLTSSGSFYGYDPLVFLVTGTGVSTADTPSVDGQAAFVEGTFGKAIRAIQTQMSIVHIGEREDDGFVVMVDGATAGAYVSANTDSDVAAAIKALVDDATSVTSTVTAKTLAASEFA